MELNLLMFLHNHGLQWMSPCLSWHFIQFLQMNVISQWRIQLWPVGGPGSHPHWPKLRAGRGCVKQSASDMGKFSFKSLTFGHFFVWKWTRSFQLQGRGLWPLPPTRGSAPGPRLGSHSACSPWSPLRQVLDLPLFQLVNTTCVASVCA